MAGRSGIRVGLGKAHEGDRFVPMGTLLDALFSDTGGVLPAAAVPQLPSGPEQRYWLLQELEALLEREALAGPMLICLDDLQWADRGTAVALRGLPIHLSGLPIAWILTLRTGEAEPELEAAIAALDAADAQRLRLAPLGAEAVAEVTADVLGGVPDAGLLALAGRAHGSPYLLMELLLGLLEESMVERHGESVRLLSDRLPERVGQSMQARLARMSELAQRTVSVAPALGREFRFDDLAALLDSAPADLLPAVSELIDADLVREAGERLAFRHDLVREAVIRALPPGAWRSLQRQAARVMLARGAPAIEVAPNLVASAAPGDDEAIGTLFAAVQRLGPSDPGGAADLARQAFELTEAGHPLRARLAADTAVLLHAAGRLSEGARFADDVLREVLPAEDEAEVRLSIAGLFSMSPDIRADAGKEALALAGVSGPMRARHHARLVHTVLTAGRMREARALLEAAQPEVRRHGDADARFALAVAEAGLAYTDGDFESGLDQLVSALREYGHGTDDSRVRLAQQWRAESLFVLDRFDEALAVLRDANAAARRAKQAWAARWFELWRGRDLLQLGRLADAAATLEGFFAGEDPRATESVVEAVGFAALGRIALHAGSSRADARFAAVAEQMLAATVPGVRRHGAWLLALQAAAAGDDDRAIALLLLLREDGEESLLPVMAMDVTDPARLARIALAAGRADIAETAARTAQRRCELNPGVGSLEAVAAHVRGLVDSDGAALGAAIEAYGRGPRVLALASALEDRGTVDDLSRALVLYTDAGATRDGARVRGRLRELGVRRRVAASPRPAHGWAGLTDSELQVIRLVGEGLTNREAAARLYLSPHTVSMHLRHAFTKLGINSRVELARVVLEHDR